MVHARTPVACSAVSAPPSGAVFRASPIGIILAQAAPLVLKEPARQSGRRLDLPGAVTAAGGIAALVYALSAAAPSGAFDVSH